MYTISEQKCLGNLRNREFKDFSDIKLSVRAVNNENGEKVNENPFEDTRWQEL